MKMNILKIVAIMLLFAGSQTSCENKGEENPKETVCNVNDPLTDLPWLKDKVDEIVLLFQAGNPLSVSIYECVYGEGETGFLVDEGNIKPFYNCSGEVLCIMGGFAGETCSGLKISSEKLIWTTYDLNVIISCNFDNPLTDLPWLREIVNERIQGEFKGFYMNIYQCTYDNGIDGFYIEPCVNCFIYNAYLASCDGVVLDDFSGTLDMENFHEKWNIKNKKLIWTNIK